MMPEVMMEVLRRSEWSVEDLDLVFCHEASRRFVSQGAAMLGSTDNPAPLIWSTVERFGNTSTLSLALQMSEADEAGRLVPGAKVLALAGSSGVSMAALTMVW
jgi:3-oxoacyl-[acyl-carrier-protein] synthase-3